MSITFGPLITEQTEIESQLKIRKKTYEEKGIKVSNPEALPIQVAGIEKDGWRLLKKQKFSARMALDKGIHEQLEDEMWCLLAKMGFKEMSLGRYFKVSLDGSPNPRQLDVFAKDDDTAIFVECTRPNHPKNKTIDALINKIKSFKEEMIKALHEQYGKVPKLKMRWIIATRDIYLSDADIEKAQKNKIILLGDNEIDYFQELFGLLNEAARHQFLAYIFRNETIDGLKISVPATKGQMGGSNFYNFLISPENLLKIAYVGHRGSTDLENMDSYQRMVSKARLSDIADYIDNGGQFPTNIVVNFKVNSPLKFEPDANKEGSVSHGKLYLPPQFASAWIIDGQHRLYGYAFSQRFKDGKETKATLPVLAFEGLPSDKETDLFVNINSKQRKVRKDLLTEINGDLKWGDPNFEDGVKGLWSRLIKKLNSNKDSPFFQRFKYTGNKIKSNIRCLTLTSFEAGLEDHGFFKKIQNSKHSKIKFGPLLDSSNDTYDSHLKKGVRVFSWYFDQFRENIPTHWDLGDSEGGFLSTNLGTRALLRVLADLLKFISESKHIDMDEFTADDIIDDLSPYVSQLVLYFQSLSADEFDTYRKRGSSKQAVTTNAMFMLKEIKEKDPLFNPPELNDFIQNMDVKGTDEARLLIDEIDLEIQNLVTRTLEEENSNWWYDDVPPKVIDRCSTKQNKDKGRKKIAQYLGFEDYKSIANINWPVLKKWIALEKKGNKSDQLLWLSKLDEIKRTTHQSKRWPANKDQVQFVRDVHDKFMKQLANNVIEDLVE